MYLQESYERRTNDREEYIMAIMVTGGTGFIGSRIVRNLLEKGETVVSFDIRPAASATGSEKLIEYQGDVMHMPHLMEAVENNNVTKVIHTAALLPPGTEDHPQHGMLVNIHGTNNIFELARWKNIVMGCKKLLEKGKLPKRILDTLRTYMDSLNQRTIFPPDSILRNSILICEVCKSVLFLGMEEYEV